MRLSKMRLTNRRFRGSAMTEYMIILSVIASCSVATYFSTLVTGSEYAGRQICGDCPEDFDPDDDPWSRWSEEELAEKRAEKEKEAEKQKEENAKDNIEEATSDENENGDDSMSDLDRQIGEIPDQYWGYMIDNWTSWLWV